MEAQIIVDNKQVDKFRTVQIQPEYKNYLSESDPAAQYSQRKPIDKNTDHQETDVNKSEISRAMQSIEMNRSY